MSQFGEEFKSVNSGQNKNYEKCVTGGETDRQTWLFVATVNYYHTDLHLTPQDKCSKSQSMHLFLDVKICHMIFFSETTTNVKMGQKFKWSETFSDFLTILSQPTNTTDSKSNLIKKIKLSNS